MTEPLLVASLAIAATLCIWTQTLVAENITAAEAKNHIGETATVCGEVASTRYATSSRGQPTFINLDKPYPNQVFTVLIWGSDRAKFGNAETTYRGKSVCVTGMIKEYRGVPEIVASDPSQIKMKSGGEK
jgi:micrococcal nuclease